MKHLDHASSLLRSTNGGALLLGLSLASCAPPAPPAASAASTSQTPAVSGDWRDRTLSTAERVERLLQQLTREEKLTLLTGYFGVQKEWNEFRFPEARP